MLEAARAKRAEGVDVVVGVVETHGRAETGAPAGRAGDPPASRQSTIAAPGSRSSTSTPPSRDSPRSSCVDELAHTNAPGSRHAKRWQDVGRAARRRHQRLHHAQRPAPREPQRRRRADHGRQGPRDRAGLGARAGGRGRAGRRDARTCCCSASARARSTFPEQAAAGHRPVLPQGQSDRAARARAPAHRRAGGRADARVYGGAGHPRDLGRGGAAPGVHRAESNRGPAGPGHAAHGGPASCRLDRRARRDALAIQRLARTERENILRALELAEQLGGRAVTSSGQSVADEILAYARDAQRQPRSSSASRSGRPGASDSAARCSTPWSAGAKRSRCSRSPGRRRPSQPRDAPAAAAGRRWRDYAGAARSWS